MSADLLAERNGYLGLKLPHAVRDLVTACATDCSKNPNMGKLATCGVKTAYCIPVFKL